MNARDLFDKIQSIDQESCVSLDLKTTLKTDAHDIMRTDFPIKDSDGNEVMFQTVNLKNAAMAIDDINEFCKRNLDTLQDAGYIHVIPNHKQQTRQPTADLGASAIDYQPQMQLDILREMYESYLARNEPPIEETEQKEPPSYHSPNRHHEYDEPQFN